MKKNIRLSIAYSGTHYFGWQKTPEGPSIEETLEKVLFQILQHPFRLQAASRTDRGVHAKEQIINFFTEKPHLNLEKLRVSIQRLLPNDVSLLTLKEEALNFHPTLDSTGKEYHYNICTCPIQILFQREFAWHYFYPLNQELMEQGAKILEGTHDFSAFSNEQTEDPIRTIHSIKIHSASDQQFCIQVTGDNFLYKMVRNLIGTLVYVGSEKIPLEDLPKILANKKRALAGITAPAQGLFLKKVFY